MFIDLGNGVSMTDEQFQEAMAERREMLNLTRNDHVIGCPLCSVIPPTALELAQEELAKAQQVVDRAEAAAKKAKTEAEGSQQQP